MNHHHIIPRGLRAFIGSLFFLVLTAFASIAQQGVAEARDANYGYVFVFADRVNLRAAPSLEADVVATLSEGTALTFVTYMAGPDTVNGQSGNWAQVIHQQQVCYVWEPLVTRWVMRSHSDPDHLFLVGKGTVPGETLFKIFYRGEKVQELQVQSMKSVEELQQIRITGSMGVGLVRELIYLEYAAFSCGEMGGDMIFAWDGTQLRPFFKDWGIGDGGFFEGVRLVLPASPLGEKGVIHVFEVAGEYLNIEEDDPDALPPIKFDYNRHKRYRWDGTKMVELASN
ncbi:MAG: SH3 domain-containing protein [Bacteroidia bacterium]|nr:SH3 domain-containing protein [Bacteroidia bacterium]